MLPEYLSTFVCLKNNQRNLRSTNTLVLPKYRTITYGKQSFKYMSSFYWNTNSNELRNSDVLANFRILAKEWIPMCACGFCVLCRICNS